MAPAPADEGFKLKRIPGVVRREDVTAIEMEARADDGFRLGRGAEAVV